MLYTTLDVICRRALLERGLPIHYYPEFLFHSSTCLRELTIDTLKVVNTRNLPVNDYGAIDLPEDFLDDVMLSFADGATLRALPHRRSINPLRIHSAETGLFEQQPSSTNVNVGDIYFPFVGLTWYWNVSDYGEPTGRVFGANGGSPYGYQVFKERRQIQLYGGINTGNAILQYISDGQSIDNASMVDTLAFSTIQSYIIWKSSPNADNEFSPQGRMFYNTKRKLKSRLSSLTGTDIINIIRTAYTAAMKS
jgi:hypothetical protein